MELRMPVFSNEILYNPENIEFVENYFLFSVLKMKITKNSLLQIL